MEVELTAPWDLADLVFVIEDTKLYINKTILMMSSDVFRTMFTADFREKQLAEIPLPGKNFDSFLLLMKVIHPPHLEVNASNVLQLLRLSHEYGVHHVTSCCEKLLLTEPPSVQKLVLADRFSLGRLREACVQYSQHTALTQLQAQPGFDQLQPDTLIEVLRHKVLQTELQQKPADVEQEEPAADLTKEFLCELISKPPSVQSLVLAERYDIPQLKETCIQYTKDKPLSELKAEPGYDKITLATQVEILEVQVKDLSSRVSEMEPKVLTFDRQASELENLFSTRKMMSDLYYYRRGMEGVGGICSFSISEGNKRHVVGQGWSSDRRNLQCLECKRVLLDKIYHMGIAAMERLQYS